MVRRCPLRELKKEWYEDIHILLLPLASSITTDPPRTCGRRQQQSLSLNLSGSTPNPPHTITWLNQLSHSRLFLSLSSDTINTNPIHPRETLKQFVVNITWGVAPTGPDCYDIQILPRARQVTRTAKRKSIYRQTSICLPTTIVAMMMRAQVLILPTTALKRRA